MIFHLLDSIILSMNLKYVPNELKMFYMNEIFFIKNHLSVIIISILKRKNVLYLLINMKYVKPFTNYVVKKI